MKFSKRFGALLLCVSVSAGMITACSKSEKEAEVKDDYAITVGYYNCDHMTAGPVAEGAGIYKELGLNVTTVGNGKVPQAMAAGQMDAGYIGTRGLVTSIPKGSPIVIAANNHLGGSEYLVVSNEIKDVKDLVGKKLAVNMDGFLWKMDYAPETGLPVEASNYQLVEIDSSADTYLAMKTGEIQAFETCDPWGTIAEQEGTGRIVSSTLYKDKSTGKQYNCCSFSMNTNFIKEHPQLAEKLVLAHTKAIEYIYTNPVESAKIFAKAYNVTEEVALTTIYKKTVGEGRTLTWKVTGDEYKNNMEIYKEYSEGQEVPEFDKIMDLTSLENCGADDFDKFIAEKVDPVFPLGMDYASWKEKALSMSK
ncbi:MAG: ABC transporter substrate-binding subunit SaoX [Filifactoraceae bacterium]